MLFVRKSTASSCDWPSVDEKVYTKEGLRFDERGNLCSLIHNSSIGVSVSVSQLRRVTSLLVFVSLLQFAALAPMLTMSVVSMLLAK